MFSDEKFTIIGKVLKGYSSFPSGHSMTVFIALTIIIFAFIPHKKEYKFLWYFLMFMFGVFLVLSRVAVGAHFPLDVYAGTAIGYIVGLLGIFINRKYDLWAG